MSQEPTRTLDQAVLSAWLAELKATNNPKFKQQCLQREPELLPRFAEHYQQLKALRRQMRRSLQHQWKRSLAGVALLIALGQAPALAATINVGGACTLVRAITAANNNTTASGNCRKGSGADTIVLPKSSTQTLTTVNNTNYGPAGLPAIRSPITIAGNGSTIRRAQSAPRFHIFSVAQAGSLSLQKTTVSGAASARFRGALYNFGGTLNVNSSTISGNTGCGISNAYDSGEFPGQGYSGRSVVTSSTISGNTGCGISTFYTERLVVANSTIINNSGAGLFSGYDLDTRVASSTISGNGGSGVSAFGAYVTIINSTINKNSGSEGNQGETPSQKLGGGVYVSGFTAVVVTNSTISGNSATLGGGLYIYQNDEGYDTNVTVTNSTITGNTATAKGGGIFDNTYLWLAEVKPHNSVR